MMKTDQLTDKNPTQLKGAYMTGDLSFSSQRYTPVSKVFSIVA
jgi:hypothetical protein